MANFIPPAHGASQSSERNYFLTKNLLQTDRQIISPYTEGCEFFPMLNLLPPYSLYSQGEHRKEIDPQLM